MVRLLMRSGGLHMRVFLLQDEQRDAVMTTRGGGRTAWAVVPGLRGRLGGPSL